MKKKEITIDKERNRLSGRNLIRIIRKPAVLIFMLIIAELMAQSLQADDFDQYCEEWLNDPNIIEWNYEEDSSWNDDEYSTYDGDHCDEDWADESSPLYQDAGDSENDYEEPLLESYTDDSEEPSSSQYDPDLPETHQEAGTDSELRIWLHGELQQFMQDEDTDTETETELKDELQPKQESEPPSDPEIQTDCNEDNLTYTTEEDIPKDPVITSEEDLTVPCDDPAKETEQEAVPEDQIAHDSNSNPEVYDDRTDQTSSSEKPSDNEEEPPSAQEQSISENLHPSASPAEENTVEIEEAAEISDLPDAGTEEKNENTMQLTVKEDAVEENTLDFVSNPLTDMIKPDIRFPDPSAEIPEESEGKAQGSNSYSNGPYTGYSIGTFTYRRSLTHEEMLSNLRSGFKKAEDPVCAVSNADNWVDVHAAKGTDSETVGRLYPGCSCFILSDENEPWVYIESGDVRGFVFSYYLTRTGISVLVPQAEETLDPLLNPAFQYTNETCGIIPDRLITEDDLMTGCTSEARAAVLNFAAQYIGKPYVWGGEDPNTGADCSGFVQYVFRQFGMTLPRTAAEQACTGTRIPVQSAQPGDLIFFMDDTGSIHHVVLYAGNGRTIEAKGKAYGIGSWDVNYSEACWAVQLIPDASPDIHTGASDPSPYTQENLELIWAIVAQEDDTSYEGALAVITSAMNRADRNYGGYGRTALAQLTAPDEYCYSPSISDPVYYQRRLGGNVPSFVKQAVQDCLTGGSRSHHYLNFRSSNRTGSYVQIGDNWYF